MRTLATLFAILAGAAAPAAGHDLPPNLEAPGSLVGLSVRIDGHPSPLYPARDGSGRYYLEARTAAGYEVRVVNRTPERLGVVLVVDGLNVISGEREALVPGVRPGRMYVLDGWGEAVVRGWRTSLQDVRRFTFVDERASYAGRSGKSNAKMGWIEAAVFRERRPYAGPPYVTRPQEPWREGRGDANAGARDRAEAEPDAQEKAAEAPRSAPAPDDHAQAAPSPADEALAGSERDGARRSYPGTGWGPRAHDPVTVVQFDPQPYAAETLTVRYEYASALRAIGILPYPRYGRDRLRERERGEDGFAAPPRW